MMLVKLSVSEITVFTLRLLTPVKILFLATFKHPVMTVLLIGDSFPMLFFSTPKSLTLKLPFSYER